MFTYQVPSCGSALRSKACADSRPTAEVEDETMTNTYHLLAQNAIMALEESRKDRLWIAVCGGPGAGKTTLATAVAKLINQLSNNQVQALCLSMDGYHYSRAQLSTMGIDRHRRGAPWTFDAERLAKDLQDAVNNPHQTKLFPAYSREESDPVHGQVLLQTHHQIIFVEGNYLMLGKLLEQCPDGKGMDLPYEYDGPCSLEDELKRWKSVTDLFDITWFVNPCAGFEEQRRRLIDRALQTWNNEKTQEWGGGSSQEAATRRVDYNDSKNAVLIDKCRKYADVVIASV